MWMSVKSQVYVEQHVVRTWRAAIIACVISAMSMTMKQGAASVSIGGHTIKEAHTHTNTVSSD